MILAKVVAVCTSQKKGEVKKPVDSAALLTGYGLEGDAHAGPWHRQISLLGVESVKKLNLCTISPSLYGDDGNRLSNGENPAEIHSRLITPGAFAENILTEGICLYTLPVGTRLQIGNALLEITQIGKECHKGCAIRTITGDCVMPREGVFAIVLLGGVIRPGDILEIVK